MTARRGLLQRAGDRFVPVRRLRSWWHHVTVITRGNVLALIGLALAALSLLQDRFSRLPWAVATILTVVGALLALRDWRHAYRPDQGFRWVKADPDMLLQRLKDSSAVVLGASPVTFVTGDEVDRLCALRVTMSEAPYRLPADLERFKPAALSFYRGDGKRLTDDWTLGLGRVGSHDALVMPVRYFDFACSSDLGRWIITDTSTSSRVHDVVADYALDPQGRLRDFGTTQLSDNIGVSTLAVTSDARAVLLHQSRHNAVNEDEYASSGSGSMEPEDAQGAESLGVAAVRGMERELCEELGLGPEDLDETRVVGFGRWIARGAKPEFLGVTRLTIPFAEVERRRRRGFEKHLTRGEEPIALDPARVGTWHELVAAVGEIDLRRIGQGAVSLRMVLQACADRALTAPSATLDVPPASGS